MTGAARAGQGDLTRGPIGRTLVLFALPTLGSSILQSLNGSINSIWIGQFLGERALAATTNANIIMFLMVAAVFGFGMAATILIGQHMGRRDVDAARRVLGTTMGMFAVISLATVIIGWLTAPALLRLLATPADVFPLALAYLRVIFIAMPAGFMTVLLTMALRGTGDSMTPLKFMLLGAVIDVALNPVFILGLGPAPRLGIEGAALATLIANSLSLAALVWNIYARDLTVRLRGPELRYLLPDRALMRVIVAKGFPMGLQMIVVSVSALVMIGLVNREGTISTAAFGAINQLWTYIQMPAMAVGAAVSAMAAQNIGAGRWDRVDRIAIAGVMVNSVMTAVLIVAVTLLDRHVLWLFLGTDGAANRIAQHINLLASWSFLPFGVAMVLAATVRANGATVAPLIILAVALFPVRLGLALAGYRVLGADALWWSFPAGSLGYMLFIIGYYLRGGWRAIRLVPNATPAIDHPAPADCEPTGKQLPVG